jgi:thiol:disulfide interchange protein
MFVVNKKKIMFSLLFMSLLVLISNFGIKKLNCANNYNQTEKVDKSFFSIDNLKDTFSPEKSPFYLIILAFLIGIFTSFTPCVYPMIPITLGILQTQATTSLSRNFFLSLSYVLGISTVYAILGYVAATSTIIFGQWLSNPWLVFAISLFFVYLAFSMFGYYEIKIPSFLTKRDSVKVKGSFLYSFIFGAISGTVASPCLTPAIAILLSFVARLGNPILGFLTLFFFSLGMGIILLVVGTFSASLNVLPKAGTWMVEVKKFFGFVLLAMCIYFFQPFLDGNAALKLYAILSLIAGAYYIIKAQKSKIKALIGIFFIILSLFIIFWGMKRKHSGLLASDLKPNSLLVALSTARHQKI